MGVIQEGIMMITVLAIFSAFNIMVIIKVYSVILN